MTSSATTGQSDVIRVWTRSAAETQALAARIEPLVRSGDVILLGGELGAGKTAFVQGLARAMGIGEAVTSPTFTLVRSYDNPRGLRLLHADMYRLEHLQEVVDLGLPELLDECPTVAVVEWGEVAAPALALEYLEVRMDFGPAEDERVVTLLPLGARWAAPAQVTELRAAACGAS